jgi:hypothetical protein
MLNTLGNIGDFLGGIGVVVTLVYLAMQIRQNTASGRAAAYQEATKALSDWSSSLARDSASMRIFLLGAEDSDELDELERQQFRLLIMSLFRHFENLHFQYLQGAMDRDTWAGWRQRISGTLGGVGVMRFWRGQKSVFSPKFQDFIERAAQDRDGTPFGEDRVA